MDIIKLVLPKVKSIHNVFTTGKNVCVMGAFATAALINQLVSIDHEDDDDWGDVDG